MGVGIVLVLTAASASAARAQGWLDRPDTTGSQRVSIGPATVTMPPGAWQLVEQDEIPNSSQNGSGVSRRGLIQVANGHIVAVAILDGNATGAQSGNFRGERYGMRPPSGCFRKNDYLDEADAKDIGDFDCLYVTHDMTSKFSPTPPWSDIYRAAAPYGGLARPMIEAQLNVTDRNRRNGLQVVIFVDPTLAGFPNEVGTWNDSQWQPDYLTPPRRAYLDKVVAWARAYRKIVKASWD